MPKALVEDGTSLRSVPAASWVCPDCERLITGSPEAHACGMAIPGPAPVVSLSPGQAMLMAPLRNGWLGTREEIQRELDGIAAAVATFPMKQPDQVMRETAAYSARLTELAVLLHRVEAQDRQYVRVRTQQVERWLTELAFQFKVASRLIEIMRQDLSMAMGRDV